MQVYFEAYESSGVLEYWILNPKTQTLEIYTLDENLYNLLDEYGPDEPIHSPLSGELAFTAGSLFD
jgi:Uma2 family endonuclease